VLYCSQRRVKHYASWVVCLGGIMKTITWLYRWL